MCKSSHHARYRPYQGTAVYLRVFVVDWHERAKCNSGLVSTGDIKELPAGVMMRRVRMIHAYLRRSGVSAHAGHFTMDVCIKYPAWFDSIILDPFSNITLLSLLYPWIALKVRSIVIPMKCSVCDSLYMNHKYESRDGVALRMKFPCKTKAS